MYDNYSIIYDGLDYMILLVRNTESQLKFIYIPSTYTVVKTVNKENNTMSYRHFTFEEDRIKQKSLEGNLPQKSIELINKTKNNQDLSITQNFFYDMIEEGMTSYRNLLDAEGE